jgi:tetratricopeptide (TPR) repeat protein
VTTPEKSRIPLSINAAMERMDLPVIAGAAAGSIPRLEVPGVLLEDYRPLGECLEWRLAEAHWDAAGLLPFVENTVPFLINNNGRLSADAAALLFAHCLESEALPARIAVLEVGAGSGLFARYFLDCFRELCEEHGTDFYARLTYVITDRSHRTIEQWCERGLFEAHGEHAIAIPFDPSGGASLPPVPGRLRGVICNYVLDVLPSAVVRRGMNGPEELCVRTHLAADPTLLAQHAARTPGEWAALASNGNAAELLTLAPLQPWFEFDVAFRPARAASIPFLEEALASVDGSAKVLLNHAALQAIMRFLDASGPDGFVLINDYGPVQSDQVEGFCSLQRFGPSVAFGVNFALLENFCAGRNISITQPDDAQRGIHTRLLSRGELPKTRTAVLQTFSAEKRAFYESATEAARAHVAAGRPHEALAAYREAVTRDPRNWYLLGEAGEFLSLQLRSFEAAIDLLRAAVAMNPCYSSWLWNALGDALYCLNRYEHAHEAYLQASRIEPCDSRTNLNLAYTLAQFGKLPEALDAISRGLAGDVRESYRARLLDKQQQILGLISNRGQTEQERLARRAQRYQSA